MSEIVFNKKKNGIELKFDEKPSYETIDMIKKAGFRWSPKQKIWYAKRNKETICLANRISDELNIFFINKEVIQENTGTNLWNLTRTNSIENNFEKYKIYDNKEIAARIRKHLRERFPMCKWSVTKDGYNSIYVHLLSSPFTIDSEVVKAIAHYAYVFAQSFNYDNSDSMTDYFDVNFYGVYENDIVSNYRYTQNENSETDSIEQDFLKKKNDFEIEEHKRAEKEIQERMAQMEIEIAEHQHCHEIIEYSAKVQDVNYFVLGCDVTNKSKEESVYGYTDDCNGEDEVKHHRENCKVERNVYFDAATYEMFKNQLLDDYSFLAGMGGSATDDNRVNCEEDYQRMSKEERKTVEWYNIKCVAIYCDNVLKMIVNPEGYSYARYVYFIDTESKIVQEYKGNTGISDEEYSKNKMLAEFIEDVSTDIIFAKNWQNTWNTENFNDYKQLIKNWIYKNNFKLTAGVVQAISIASLKTGMYRILTETDSIQEQFLKANLIQNQKITIVRMNDFGMVNVIKGYFKSYKNTTYAQYDDAIKLVFRPERKRYDYNIYLYREVLIFDGWVDIPENLFWEEIESNTPGVVCKRTRFRSCDNQQYDVVLRFFAEKEIKPIVNTYKPQF